MPEKEIIYKGRRIVEKPGKLEHHLYIDGEHVRVFQPTPNGKYFSTHFYKGHNTLDDLARDLIDRVPKFKPRRAG